MRIGRRLFTLHIVPLVWALRRSTRSQEILCPGWQAAHDQQTVRLDSARMPQRCRGVLFRITLLSVGLWALIRPERTGRRNGTHPILTGAYYPID